MNKMKIKCTCGNPDEGLVVHRADKPCYTPADVRLEAIKRLYGENQRLTAIIADLIEAKADARRYQFIAGGGAYIEPDGKQIYMAIDSGAYYSTKADLDAAIDAEIKHSGGGK